MKKFVEKVQAFNADLAEQPVSGYGLFAIFVWNVIYNLEAFKIDTVTGLFGIFNMFVFGIGFPGALLAAYEKGWIRKILISLLIGGFILLKLWLIKSGLIWFGGAVIIFPFFQKVLDLIFSKFLPDWVMLPVALTFSLIGKVFTIISPVSRSSVNSGFEYKIPEPTKDDYEERERLDDLRQRQNEYLWSDKNHKSSDPDYPMW
jgi:hypothetical protein